MGFKNLLFFQLAYGNRNATDFLSWLCILLFCWICLLCLMGLSVCVCMFGIFRISTQTILSVNKDNFTFLFSIWITSVFSCVIVYSKSSSTMWSISGKSGHLCFFPNLRRKNFSLSPWVWCSLWIFHIWLLLYWGSFLLCLVSCLLLSWMGIKFWQMLFLHQLRW